MKSARFLAPARVEFVAEAAYDNTPRPGFGAEFVTAVEEAVVRGVALPESGFPLVAGMHRVDIGVVTVNRTMRDQGSPANDKGAVLQFGQGSSHARRSPR